jgi:hypothetical protein
MGQCGGYVIFVDPKPEGEDQLVFFERDGSISIFEGEPLKRLRAQAKVLGIDVNDLWWRITEQERRKRGRRKE